MADICLSLGSNSGDRSGNLRLALDLLGAKIEIANLSAIYETIPWGYEDLHTYYNMVATAKTTLAAEEVLDLCLEVESRMGRVRREGQRYTARNIDIDLLLYNQQVISGKRLTLPHPRMHLRNFVLVPLCEVAPEWIHPVFNKSIKQLLPESPDTDVPLKLNDGI